MRRGRGDGDDGRDDGGTTVAVDGGGGGQVPGAAVESAVALRHVVGAPSLLLGAEDLVVGEGVGHGLGMEAAGDGEDLGIVGKCFSFIFLFVFSYRYRCCLQ